MIGFLVHYGIHFIIPIGVAYWGFRKEFKKALLILWGGIIIDLDHLLASPVFDPERCSLFFHPLHSSYAIALYLGLLAFKKTRLYGIALCMHMIADGFDCIL